MGIFRKNKRQFGICSHRRVFVALFLVGILSISGTISFILRAQAADGPIRSIEIFSEHANFSNNEQGAWKITKSAKWTSKTTAQVTFEIDSIAKPSGNDKDIILVLDNSSSMDESLHGSNSSSSKLGAIKTNAAELINNTLDNQDSQISIISFATDAEIVVPFTNDVDTLITGLNSIEAYGSTNYYKALVCVGEVLADYEIQADRDIVVLFVTDGVPVKQTPLEVVEYRALKSQYESLIINAVQYDMGDTIISQLARISDNQFIVQDAAQLDKSLFDAASVPYYYQSFNVADYVDTDYWTLDDVSVNLGTVTMDTNEQSVDWNLGRYFRPGQETKPHLTISLNLKEEFHEADSRFSTNVREIASSSIIDGEDENISSNETPVLQHKYNVSYDANLPASCDNSVELPGSNRYFVFDTVEIQGITLSCEGYKFMGWQLATAHVVRINTDYFRMPEADVVLRAVWSKPSIGKSMDGTVHQRVSAEFDAGGVLNDKMKALAGQTYNVYHQMPNSDIKAIKHAHQLSASVDILDDSHILSSANSDVPIYGWFDDGIIYYYTEADEIFLNQDSRYVFYSMVELSDISGLYELNTSRVQNMNLMFSNTAIENIDALINWDTSSVKNMSDMFAIRSYGHSTLTNIDGAINWDTSNVTNMSNMFAYVPTLTNIDGAANWNTSNVTNMHMMFTNTNITNIDSMLKWDTSNVTDMSSMFSSVSSLVNIDGALNWDVSNVKQMDNLFSRTGILTTEALKKWNTDSVTSMNNTFSGAKDLEDISGLRDWDTSNTKSMSNLFTETKIVNTAALSEWNTSNVTNMHGMFSGVKTLENIGGLENWNTSNVSDMGSMFGGTRSLEDITVLTNWNVSSVTNMGGLFASSNIANVNALYKWDTSSVVDMSSMFSSTPISDIDSLENWKTQNVKTMKNMFTGTRITNIDGASKWNTQNLTDMSSMFIFCNYLQNVNGALNWDTSNVTTISSLFYYNNSLTDISGLRKWNVSKVEDMQNTFRGVGNVTSVDALFNWKTLSVKNLIHTFDDMRSLTSLDGLSEWDVSQVTDMDGLFSGASKIIDITGLSNWKTVNLDNMNNMFTGVERLTSVSALSDWDVSKVRSMSGTFSRMTRLSDIQGLSGWNTSNVTKMGGMFNTDTSLVDLSAIEDWNVSKVTDMSSMFGGDSSITNLSPLENWEPINLENSNNMFHGIPDSVTRPSWYQ